MSSTLREASKDTLQAKDKTYHYYSLPLAAKSLGDITVLQFTPHCFAEIFEVNLMANACAW
ncbi:hypothetical protein ACUOA8_37290, partial [Escherichia sp. SS-MK2]